MTAAVLVTAVLLAGVALALAWPELPPVRRRRLEREDRERTRQRIEALQRLAAVEPDDIPRAPDLPAGARRKLRRRQHPIAHKRSGRPY